MKQVTGEVLQLEATMTILDRRSILLLPAGAALLQRPPEARAADEALPRVRVGPVRRAFHNGEHNAFTDLVRYQGRLYLTFRSCPDGHSVFPTSSIIVLASEDGREWRTVNRFSVPRRDVRDPHFLVFQDKLFVYTGGWYCGGTAEERREMNRHLGYAAWTDDGRAWHGPRMLDGTYGHYIWRAAAHGGKAYLCGRRKRDFVELETREQNEQVTESALLESEDGFVWRRAGLFQEQYGNETAFLFEADASILAVARSGGGRNAQICRSRPPYRQWSRVDLDRYVGGPLVVRWGNRHLAGGRKLVSGQGRTTLYWLANDRLHEFAELPSGGDNSYPGFIELSPSKALVSYYSSHETDAAGKAITAIYLVELEIVG
jgi:hypothetical protein